jgi:lipopolysaccharide export system ATP-binding protein
MSNIKKFRIKFFKDNYNIVKLSKISLKFNNKIILDNLNLELNKGQILGLLGPNGVGKSTIFNLIIGLIKPDFGSIFISSIEANKYPIYIRANKFQIGFVPQNGGYFHDLTVYENLKAIAEIKFQDQSYREQKVNSLISRFELDGIRNLKALFLSGGQKKKLVIAMTLISEPKILLLDEPFAALDILTIKMLQKIIINLQSTTDVSIILCDHQARDLLECVDTAAIIHDGKVIAQGTPSEITKNLDAKNAYFGDSFKVN